MSFATRKTIEGKIKNLREERILPSKVIDDLESKLEDQKMTRKEFTGVMFGYNIVLPSPGR